MTEPGLNLSNYVSCTQVDDVTNFKIESIDKMLSLIHINIRSLINRDHFRDLKTFLNMFNFKFDIIVITETWVKDDKEFEYLNIPDYHCEYYVRNGRRGGGVAVYILNVCNYQILKYDCFSEAESVFIEIKHEVNNIILGAIYRPPDTCINTFNQELDNFVSQIQIDKKKCILIGDVNINILDVNKSLEYTNVMEGNGFMPYIQDIPTRVHNNSSTLIDHIYSNIDNVMCNSGVINVDLSDHKPVFCILENYNVKVCQNKTSKICNMCPKNLSEFRKNVLNSDLTKVYEAADVNEAYNNFLEILTESSKCIWYPRSSDKKYTKKHWITRGILVSIKKKNRMYKKLCKQPFNVQLKQKYNKYKLVLTTVIRNAEKIHFNEKFLKASSSSKETWKVINEVLNKEKRNIHMPQELKSEGNNNVVNEPIEICNMLNNFFINIGKQVQESINLSGKEKDFEEYLGTPSINSCYAHPVTKIEIEKIIEQLDTNKSFGLDNIPAKLLKISKDIISEPLEYLINRSISEGIVPDQLKIAKVIPLFKSGDRTSPNNYRPISILPVISKIFEKVMHTRLTKFLNDQNFFYKFQFGFRTHLDTKLAISELVNSLQHNIDNGLVSVGVFIDLKKAFDTINHQILLKKLYHYGVRGNVYKWFDSYLKNRKQIVNLGNTNSNILNIETGIPQGSIIGPLLFLVYVNDMVKSIKKGNIKMFADDTNIFYSGNSVMDMKSVIEKDLETLYEWLKVNKLSVNVKKSNFMLIQSNQKEKMNDLNIKLKLCNSEMEEVNFCKYLGVYIDSNLSWQHHIAMVCKKIRPIIGVLSKVRHLIPSYLLRTIYYSLIHPHILYCIETWGSSCKCYIKPLCVLHKKLIRILTFSHPIEHTYILYPLINILPVTKIYFQNVCQMVYKELNSNIPIRFNFTPCSNIHEHFTRSSKSGQLYNLTHNTNYFVRSVFNAGVKFYNVLPTEIKDSVSVMIFKSKLKQWLNNTDIDIYKILGIDQ
jgi:exonuclease III